MTDSFLDPRDFPSMTLWSEFDMGSSRSGAYHHACDVYEHKGRDVRVLERTWTLIGYMLFPEGEAHRQTLDAGGTWASLA